MKPCPCGSGEDRRALYDARRIFAGFVCDRCEAAKRAKFRPEIFTSADYWADEPIEED